MSGAVVPIAGPRSSAHAEPTGVPTRTSKASMDAMRKAACNLAILSLRLYGSQPTNDDFVSNVTKCPVTHLLLLTPQCRGEAEAAFRAFRPPAEKGNAPT